MPIQSKLSIDVIFLILLLLFLDTLVQIFFKIGVTRLGEFPVENFYAIGKYTLQLVLNPFVVGGVIGLIFAFFTWLMLISKVDLSFAHPMTSLIYATIPLCSSWLLDRIGSVCHFRRRHTHDTSEILEACTR
jgi:flagellar biosynthesis protein FliQ